VPDGTTVAEVLKKLAVPADVKVVTMINGRHCALDQPLEEGDKLVFFPPLEGGIGIRGITVSPFGEIPWYLQGK
jgi:molybdopterin converting factor small subunit